MAHGQRDMVNTLNAHLSRLLDGMRHNWTAEFLHAGHVDRRRSDWKRRLATSISSPSNTAGAPAL